MAEIISNSITICAKKCFSSKTANRSSSRSTPRFSIEVREAYKEHKEACKQWRLAGRPASAEEPAKAEKLKTQTTLQKIRRETEECKTREFNNDLMNSYHTNISQIYSKINRCRDDKNGGEIKEIETLEGIFKGSQVLEGFRLNTQNLCSEKADNEFQKEFLSRCENDLLIIIDIITNEAKNIPPIKVIDLAGNSVKET